MSQHTIPARKLFNGARIFDVQIDGERIARKTAVEITTIAKHGPCITTLTSRGYVEYDENEAVQVTAGTYKAYEATMYLQAATDAHNTIN